MTGRVMNNALPSSVDVVILASDVERVYRRLCLAQMTLSVFLHFTMIMQCQARTMMSQNVCLASVCRTLVLCQNN